MGKHLDAPHRRVRAIEGQEFAGVIRLCCSIANGRKFEVSLACPVSYCQRSLYCAVSLRLCFAGFSLLCSNARIGLCLLSRRLTLSD